ncbi:MAG: DUF1289 domain-containing protein [Sandarakinorhabdus sp.]|nr:DUF1289 domain-containing protein [Sandarakinorhabdus sp.]MBS3962843.1 DUF1289 domain-containing protein [Sandarakinorhabdus sp.]
MAEPVATQVPSPCINLCRVSRGLCTGCFRTLDEIGAWPTAPDDVRRAILLRAKTRRAR